MHVLKEISGRFAREVLHSQQYQKNIIHIVKNEKQQDVSHHKKFSTQDEKIILELVMMAETELNRELKAGTCFGTSNSRESEMQVRQSPLAGGGSTASQGICPSTSFFLSVGTNPSMYFFFKCNLRPAFLLLLITDMETDRMPFLDRSCYCVLFSPVLFPMSSFLQTHILSFFLVRLIFKTFAFLWTLSNQTTCFCTNAIQNMHSVQTKKRQSQSVREMQLVLQNTGFTKTQLTGTKYG